MARDNQKRSCYSIGSSRDAEKNGIANVAEDPFGDEDNAQVKYRTMAWW